LIEALADERGIPRESLQALIDSGEYGIGEGKIRKSKLFTPKTAAGKIGVNKNDLLAAVDPINVFSNELGRPMKEMKWQSVNCPFHEDDHPSLRVLLPDGGFNCMGCGERGGSVIDLVMKLHRLDFPEAIQYLATNYTTMRAQS
jgi:hypothetical protein